MTAARFILIVVIAVGLTGCPTPVPTCRQYSSNKPGINIEEPLKTMATLPEGAAFVFGQFILQGPEDEGILSVRLISYKDYELYKRPYGVEEILIEADGTFQWILPPGHYVIQPIYYHYDYKGVNYQSSKQINISLSFDISEVEKVYYLGKVDLVLSPELDLRDIIITNELATACSRLPTWVCTKSNQPNVNLVRHDLGLDIVNVARRKKCRDWNIISWCIIAPHGGCFNVDR